MKPFGESVIGEARAISAVRPSSASAPLGAAAFLRFPAARAGAGVGAFVLAIVTAGALAHVAVRLKGLEVAYDLGRERRISTEMEEQRRRLQIEIGMLKDPRRVIAIARDKLNMGPPAPESIWRLGAGRALGDAVRSRTAVTTTSMTATGANRVGGPGRSSSEAAGGRTSSEKPGKTKRGAP